MLVCCTKQKIDFGHGKAEELNLVLHQETQYQNMLCFHYAYLAFTTDFFCLRVFNIKI